MTGDPETVAPRRKHVPMPRWKRPLHRTRAAARRALVKVTAAAGTVICYDSSIVGNLPAGATAYLGYVDGIYASPLPAATYHLTLSVIPGSATARQANGPDVEPGCYSNAQVYGMWPANPDPVPVVYTMGSNVDSLVATMTANGYPRSSYRLLSAHYGAGQHICGPSSCGICSNQCDGTQYASNAYYDTSILAPGFFGAPAPAPAPAPATTTEDNMTATLFYGGHWYFYAIGPDGRVNVYKDNVSTGQVADSKTGTPAVAKGSLSAAVDTSGNVLLLMKGSDDAIWKAWQTAGKGTWTVSRFGGVLA